MNELKCFFTRAFDYKGKSGRREFLFPLLLPVFFLLAYFFADEVMDVDDDILDPLFAIVFLAYLVSFASLCVRRLHDTMHSGWWILMTLIPVSNIVLIGYLSLAKGAASEKEAKKGCFIAAFVAMLLAPILLCLPFLALALLRRFQ